MANDLNVLIPVIIGALQRVLRQTGFLLNGTSLDASNAVGAVGQVLQTPFTNVAATYDVTPGPVPPALVNSTPTMEPLVLTKYKGSRFHLTGEDWLGIANRGPEFRSRSMDECIASLIHEMATFQFNLMETNCARALGTQGVDPFVANPNLLVDGWQLLSDALAPELDRFGILSTSEYGSASKLSQFQKLNEAPIGTNFALASLGMLSNFKVGYDQAIGTHVAGTGAGYLVNGAASIGDTTVVIDTGAGTFLPGDVVHFGAVTANKYVVKVGTGVLLTLYTGLVAAVPDNATVTVAASHRANLLVHRDQTLMGVRPPAEAPDGDAADVVQIISDPITGVSLRLAHYKGYHAGQWETSVVYGGARNRARFGVKLIA